MTMTLLRTQILDNDSHFHQTSGVFWFWWIGCGISNKSVLECCWVSVSTWCIIFCMFMYFLSMVPYCHCKATATLGRNYEGAHSDNWKAFSRVFTILKLRSRKAVCFAKNEISTPYWMPRYPLDAIHKLMNRREESMNRSTYLGIGDPMRCIHTHARAHLRFWHTWWSLSLGGSRMLAVGDALWYVVCVLVNIYQVLPYICIMNPYWFIYLCIYFHILHFYHLPNLLFFVVRTYTAYCKAT